MPRHSLITVLKLAIFVAVLALALWKLHGAWEELRTQQLRDAIGIDWSWALPASASLAAVMLTSASVWFWLLRRMDRSATPGRLYGAYCYSHLGKYVPGKVMVLLMRLDRTRRMGVDPTATVVATLVENATFLVSGAAVGILALAERAGGRARILAGAVLAGAAVLAAVHPSVFYRLVNPVLRRMGRPEIAADRQLRTSQILASALLMAPCWLFGGLALWATARSVAPVDIVHVWRLGGAFALSVVLGMISLLPGGLGVREVTQGVLLVPVLVAALPAAPAAAARAQVLAAAVVVVQRLLQLAVELTLGLVGGIWSRQRVLPD